MEFIREQIKEKPINKKRVVKRVALAALCGIVFALAVCIVLLLMAPFIKDAFADASTEETTSQITESSETESEEESEQETTQSPDIVIPESSLDIKDYQELQNQLYAIGNEVNHSIVTITGVTDSAEGTESTATSGQGSGVIVAEDNNYLYVMTEERIIQAASKIQVTFIDEAISDALVLKKDKRTGIVILTVEKRQLDESTSEKIAVATLGTSYAVTKGTLVLALGSPLGMNYSVSTGNITSINNEVMTIDHNYSIFTTDIAASEDGTGILINTKGEIVGMVLHSLYADKEIKTLTAVAISEVTAIIESLSSGKDMPYIGAYISTVTDKLAQEYDMPKGVFIKDIVMDSPAMLAGLQSGDIITHINGEEINSDVIYTNKIAKLIPGTKCEIIVKRQNGDKYNEIKCEVEIGILQ